MASFWDSSWESVDLTRVEDYIRSFDIGADEVIETLRQQGINSVCDAGCGCGIYAAKLAANGFAVSGFDVSARAVDIARALLQKADLRAELKCSSVLATGYAGEQFDCVIARDVLDHISKADAVKALEELCRITRHGGIILFTMDAADEEYEAQPHMVNADGDYIYTLGKWKGMVFHPYTEREIDEIMPSGVSCEVCEHGGERAVWLRKAVHGAAE